MSGDKGVGYGGVVGGSSDKGSSVEVVRKLFVVVVVVRGSFVIVVRGSSVVVVRESFVVAWLMNLMILTITTKRMAKVWLQNGATSRADSAICFLHCL